MSDLDRVTPEQLEGLASVLRGMRATEDSVGEQGQALGMDDKGHHPPAEADSPAPATGSLSRVSILRWNMREVDGGENEDGLYYDGMESDPDGKWVQWEDYATLMAEVDALEATGGGWQESAAQFARNAQFYRGIVQQIGAHYGVAARTSDDGSIQHDVLALKVPELVAAQQVRLAKFESLALTTAEISALDQFLSYGMTRGNHGEADPQLPGPLTPVIANGVAMDAWNKLRGQRAAAEMA